MSTTQYGDADKIHRQLQLEQESVDLGIKRYQDMKRDSDLTELPPGLRLLSNAMEPMIKALRLFKASTKAAGFLVETRKYLNQFSNEEIAFITAQRCINAISTPREPIQRVAIHIATNLKDHYEYQLFKKQAPGYLHVVEKNLASTTHEGHRRTVIMRAKRKLGIADQEMTEMEKLHIGIKCIQLFIEATGLVEKERLTNDTIVLRGSDKVLEWLETQHAKCELLNPIYLPMIVPPRPWTCCYDGGFLTNNTVLKWKLVKTRDTEALEKLDQQDMPQVYKAINAVQNTAWCINKKVLQVLRDAWFSDMQIGDMPSRELEPLPSTFWQTDEEFQVLKANNPDVIKAWKAARTAVYDRRIRTRSKRFALIQKIQLAEKFQDESEIFFVWQLDWRGRMYPVQSFINPQADDSGRALIKFAEGKKLGERGAFWLKVHLANKFGFDKVGFEERVKWVEENEASILRSASDPLDSGRFWWEADSPYQFLAACFEYAEYKKLGNDMVSHLPIALDGSCNGLQNFSALLRDEVGGRAVNLVPSAEPSDVYSIVAQLVSRRVEDDARAGDENARVWVGKVDRSIAKRNVMTVPYGAKKYGMKNQLMAELRKRDTKDSTYLGVDDNFAPAKYLADKMYEGIGDVVIAARKAMDWLQEVAKIAAKQERPITWTTPVGYMVHQRYMKSTLKRVDTYFGGVRYQLGLMQDTNKMDKVKQANGIAPNFIHSLDASHLMLTINKLVDARVKSFAMIHDSYATHAANTDLMAETLREAFIEQYTPNVLEHFRNEVMKQLPPELQEQIPGLPPMGKLELEAVRESRYFFA